MEKNEEDIGIKNDKQDPLWWRRRIAGRRRSGWKVRPRIWRRRIWRRRIVRRGNGVLVKDELKDDGVNENFEGTSYV